MTSEFRTQPPDPDDQVRAALAASNADIYDDHVQVLDHYSIVKVMNAEGEVEMRIINSTQDMLTSEVYGWIGWALEMTRKRLHGTTEVG